MQRLYIDRKDAQLSVEQKRLVVRYPQPVAPLSYPLRQLDTLVLLNSVQFSSGFLTQLAKQGIDVLCLHSRDSDTMVSCTQFTHGNYQRLVKQVVLSQHQQKSQQFATGIVQLKLTRQLRLLQLALRRRPELRTAVTPAIKQLQNSLLQLKQQQLPIEQLLGLEGSAAAAYFQAYSHLFAPSLKFTHRNRRPPKDPVNAILSLCYSMLYGEAVKALNIAGLHPAIGALHALSYNRESLACDLVELVRPLADRFTWRIFAQQQLRAEHFAYDNGACLLTKTGREHFFPWYETAARSWRRYLKRIARHWAQLIDGETL